MEQTDSQELLAIKDFFNKYGKLIVVVILCGLVLLGGNSYWRKTRMKTANQAAQIFQEMAFAELRQDAENAASKGAQLINDYSDTPYAQFAGLLLGKMAVTEGDLDKAAEKLRWVAEQSSSKNIAKHLATVRLSAVLLQQGKLDEALKLVEKDSDQAYTSLYAQARGDVYVAKNDFEQAKKAYQLAIQSLPDGMQSPVLQMKLIDLGGDVNA